jgi:hypothetical protein
MKRTVALVIIVALLAGCATTEQQTRTEGTAAGAGIGALIGAGIGALAGGGKGAAIGAGVGAVVGGVAGYSYANSIVKRRQLLQGKENDLDARISYAQAVNKDTQDYNARLEQQVAATRDKIDDLEAKVRRNEISQSALKREKNSLSKELSEARDNQALIQKELADLNEFRSNHEQSSQLDAEIDRLEMSLSRVKKNTNALAALNQRI